MDLISVVITTHNRKNLLCRAISSVLSQTYQNIELIVVDDASDDGTEKTCSSYPLVYIKIPREESRGGNYARNLGIKSSHGTYVAFLDDDDYWFPDKIEKQYMLITEKKCNLVYCARNVEIIDGDKTTTQLHSVKNQYPHDVSKEILFGVCTVTSCMMARRDALFMVNLFDEELKFWQEYELTIRLAQLGPFYYINEPLVVYRLDKGDKKRLTSKFFEWKKAVSYVYAKHRTLYCRLSINEKIKAKLFYWKDASNRSRSNNLYLQYFKYKSISILASFYLKVVRD